MHICCVSANTSRLEHSKYHVPCGIRLMTMLRHTYKSHGGMPRLPCTKASHGFVILQSGFVCNLATYCSCVKTMNHLFSQFLILKAGQVVPARHCCCLSWANPHHSNPVNGKGTWFCSRSGCRAATPTIIRGCHAKESNHRRRPRANSLSA